MIDQEFYTVVSYVVDSLTYLGFNCRLTRMTIQRFKYFGLNQYGQIAQSVEQGTENPRVGGSIPPLATKLWLSP